VIDFPMFEYDEEENRYVAAHHRSRAEGRPRGLLATDPAKALAKAYDMALNGWEIGGGSVRIHREDVQSKVFRALKIDADEAKLKFGFLLDALQYGAPRTRDRVRPRSHRDDDGGAESIRDVIAFPKTQRAQCLLTQAPSAVDEKQLRELHIRLRNAEAKTAEPRSPDHACDERRRRDRRTHAAAVPKIPESVLVVIYTRTLDVLLLERADHAGFWQSVTGSRATANEPLRATCGARVAEETGLALQADAFDDWNLTHRYEIYAQWRKRYAPGVTHNTEQSLDSASRSVSIRPGPGGAHSYRWLPWRDAADACFSWTNAGAIRQLERLGAAR